MIAMGLAGWLGLQHSIKQANRSTHVRSTTAQTHPHTPHPHPHHPHPHPNHQVFGHDKAAVLEGGLPAWKAAGLETDSSPVSDDQLQTSAAAVKAAGGGGGATRYKASLQRDKVRIGGGGAWSDRRGGREGWRGWAPSYLSLLLFMSHSVCSFNDTYYHTAWEPQNNSKITPVKRAGQVARANA